MKHNSVETLIGNTPMVRLDKLNPNPENVNLWAKCEYFLPSGSIKDRMVSYILQKNIENGNITKDTTILASSSGNTGSSVAMFSAMKGLKCKVFTSPKCSQEKMDTIKAFGADLEIVEKNYEDYEYLVEKKLPNSFGLHQYDNPLNAEAYYNSLGPEIYQALDGKVDYFVAGGSTGGTVTGTGRYLKDQNPNTKVIMADPIGSIFYEAFTGIDPKDLKGKPFLVEGVGKGTMPGVLDLKVVDDFIRLHDKESFHYAGLLATKQGLFAGGSSGMNVAAACKLAETITTPNTNIVCILPDSGLKYLSKLHSEDWRVENNVNWSEEDESAFQRKKKMKI